MSLAETVNDVRRAIVQRIAGPLSLTKTHFAPPRTEQTDADFPLCVVQLRSLREAQNAGTISTTAWLAQFEVTYFSRVRQGFEASEEQKIAVAQTINDALMTDAVFANIAYMPMIERVDFETAEAEGSAWQFSVAVTFTCIIEEVTLS